MFSCVGYCAFTVLLCTVFGCLCFLVCVFLFLCAYEFVGVFYVTVCVCWFVFLCVCEGVCACLRRYMCVCVGIYMCMFVHWCVFVYVYLFVCVC